MGYYTYVTGNLRFEPELTEQEAEDFADFLEDADIFEFSLDAGNDTLIPYDDSFKAYWFEENLRKAVDWLGKRKWSGYMEGEGEDNTDLWRVRVVDNKIELVHPTITWPKGW